MPENIVRHPYIVNIRGLGRSVCSGALVGNYTVVTAASCVDPRFADDKPLLWINSLFTEDLTGEERFFQTEETVFHPNYTNPNIEGYDIALLKLNETAFPLRPLRLLPSPYIINDTVGQPLLVLSYGKTTFGGGRATRLQVGQVTSVDDQRCIDADIGFLQGQMLCVDGIVTCSDDKGGPVFYGRSQINEILYGIVSGTDCFEDIELSGVTSTITPEAIAWLQEIWYDFEYGTKSTATISSPTDPSPLSAEPLSPPILPEMPPGFESASPLGDEYDIYDLLEI